MARLRKADWKKDYNIVTKLFQLAVTLKFLNLALQSCKKPDLKRFIFSKDQSHVSYTLQSLTIALVFELIYT